VAASTAGDPVVATGGGVVEDPANRGLLAEAFTVLWLALTPAEAAARLADHHDRPLLAGDDPEAALDDLLARRQAHYAALANATVPVGGRSFPEVVEALQEALRALETNP
jgi:shikimate kinase